MESSSVEGTEINPPSDAEMSARLERATRSALASSSLASYSYSEPSSREQPSQFPSLSDLLTHVGPPDCSQCPSCRAPLPLGPRSTLCLACDATIVEIPDPVLSSSLAFRQFSEALGLENDIGVAEEDNSPDHEASTSSLARVDARTQIVSSHVENSVEQESPYVQPKVSEADVPSTTGDISSVTPSETMGLPAQAKPSILDYSAKLEGISLDDFFSSQVNKQEVPAPLSSDSLLIDVARTLQPTDASSVEARKDFLFWDPLSENIIPDGFDMMMTGTRPISSTDAITPDKATFVEEDDDPFDSWEGDFQSAPPAFTDTFTVRQSSNSLSFSQPREFEDLFGNLSITTEKANGKSLDSQGSNGWANNTDFFGSITHTTETRLESQGSNGWVSGTDFFGSVTHTTVGRDTHVHDLLLGSDWPQSMQPPTAASLPTNNTQSTSFFNGGDMLGLFSPVQTEMAGINESSLDFALEGNSAAAEEISRKETLSSQSAGRKKKIVGSLLSQLHDLSFMLTDKLVIKAEGKGKDSKQNSPN